MGWLEVNISCPNVHGGGAAFGDSQGRRGGDAGGSGSDKKAHHFEAVPTAANIAAVAKACEDEGADGVSPINTMPGMRIDLKRRRSLLANTTGGMSGPGMFRWQCGWYQVYEAIVHPHRGHGAASPRRRTSSN